MIEGLGSRESAGRHYGVILRENHSIDQAATDSLRHTLRTQSALPRQPEQFPQAVWIAASTASGVISVRSTHGPNFWSWRLKVFRQFIRISVPDRPMW